MIYVYLFLRLADIAFVACMLPDSSDPNILYVYLFLWLADIAIVACMVPDSSDPNI